jgi:hypothetical protein
LQRARNFSESTQVCEQQRHFALLILDGGLKVNRIHGGETLPSFERVISL